MNENEKFITLAVTPIQRKAIEDLFTKNNWQLKMNAREETPLFIKPNDGFIKCVHCFCQPCITDERNRQTWWGFEPLAKSEKNCNKRKVCYQGFYAMLSHAGVWECEEYKGKKEGKALSGSTDPSRRRRRIWEKSNPNRGTKEKKRRNFFCACRRK